MAMSELENAASLKPTMTPDGPPRVFSPGPYNGYGKDGAQPFTIEVDAKPLQALVEDAHNGVRIYEQNPDRRSACLAEFRRDRYLCGGIQDPDERVRCELGAQRY